MIFRDRTDAGRRLAAKIASRNFRDPVVLALPRGGLPVAVEVARALRAPLDIVLVRKVGVPNQPELAAAAVVDGEQPHVVLNPPVMKAAGLDMEDLAEEIERERREIERRRSVYMQALRRAPIEARTVIVIDDGIATGTTIRAALHALRGQNPAKLVLAIPVAPRDTLEDISPLVDEIICLEQPEPFYAVGAQYDDFRQLSDDDVIGCLQHARSVA